MEFYKQILWRHIPIAGDCGLDKAERNKEHAIYCNIVERHGITNTQTHVRIFCHNRDETDKTESTW